MLWRLEGLLLQNSRAPLFPAMEFLSPQKCDSINERVSIIGLTHYNLNCLCGTHVPNTTCYVNSFHSQFDNFDL